MKMTKRIIDGKTYNTETATLLAETAHRGNYGGEFDQLYQTRHGAYFQHDGDWGVSNEDGPLVNITPLPPSKAQAWMEKHASASLIEKHFGEQPEAGESESRITVRIPDALKSQIEAMAATHKQSLNAWIMRCVEGCAMHQRELPLKPFVQRGYKFTGPNADRNGYIYGLFRLGARLDYLASACGLALPQAEQIIAEGNGGSLPTVYFDGSGGIVRLPVPER
jgi:HicB family